MLELDPPTAKVDEKLRFRNVSNQEHPSEHKHPYPGPQNNKDENAEAKSQQFNVCGKYATCELQYFDCPADSMAASNNIAPLKLEKNV
ncbi:hypothetical protein EYZ11_007901 [Aspergillus tanneri]|uniref:Uncharacterized protein n=1 Tax=Aspergillus tanneri TaxID=1220188 RepID=A0A4S3JBT4_9EURO|nr:hypothetical protein EYZ11_007901 [Aspergillus tanneri]